MYEHQIAPDFDLLHDIRHTQAFSENAKQNLSYQAKYNQGFGYAKRAIGISLDMGCEDKLNGILQSWIKEKEKEKQSETLTCNSNKENLPNVSNPYRTRTKGIPRKRVENALEENQIKIRSRSKIQVESTHVVTIKVGDTTLVDANLKRNQRNLNPNDFLEMITVTLVSL